MSRTSIVPPKPDPLIAYYRRRATELRGTIIDPPSLDLLTRMWESAKAMDQEADEIERRERERERAEREVNP